MRGNPVARATVTLWEHYAGEPDEGDRALLARGNTDWEGNFTFNGVRSSEGAWIEVKALYYLGFQGPSFRIAPGEALEIATVTLHFGGSMQGEVFGEAGRKVPHANVRLIPGFTHRGAAAATRTDSKGTFLFSGLEPGDYTLEVLVDGEVAASVDGLWVQADAPTLKVHVHLDRNSLTFPEDQDLQQFRVYRAERIISRGSRRFGSLEGIQEYVDGMMASSWWESGFREVGAIQVRMGEDEDPARGGVDSVEEETGERESRVSGHIELPRWGWDELTALHEVAHVLSQEGDHGRLFARDFFFLVSVMLGAAAASELSLAYAAEGVLW